MKWLVLSCFFALATTPIHSASLADLAPQILKADDQPDVNAVRGNLTTLKQISAEPHQILGIQLSAQASEAKRAYHELALKWHPDKTPGKFAEEIFKIIQASYEYYKATTRHDKETKKEGLETTFNQLLSYLQKFLETKKHGKPAPQPTHETRVRPTTPTPGPKPSTQQHRTPAPFAEKRTYQPQAPVAPQPASTEPKVDREAAVKKIQAAQRAAAARKLAQQKASNAKLAEEKKAQEEDAARAAAALTIQRTYKGYVAQKNLREARQTRESSKPASSEPSQSQRADAAITIQRAYRARRQEQTRKATAPSNVTSITLQGLTFILVDKNGEFFFPSLGTNFAGKTFAAQPDDHRASPDLLTPLLLNKQERLLVFTELFKAGISKKAILKTLRLYNPETEEWFDVSDKVQQEIEIAYSIAFEQPQSTKD